MDDPEPLHHAPALERGLALLERLNRDGRATLERLATESGWPKASVLRLLRTLEHLGAAGRDPADKRWFALQRLVASASGEERLRAACGRALALLAARSGHTAELFAPVGGAMVMIDRSEPRDAEVAVRARIGFQRDGLELDAVTMLAAAAGLQALPAASYAWRDGVQMPLAAADRAALVSAAGSAGAAADLGLNSNGVRRLAALVRRADGRGAGVVAMACAGLPPGPGDGALLALLAAICERIRLP